MTALEGLELQICPYMIGVETGIQQGNVVMLSQAAYDRIKNPSFFEELDEFGRTFKVLTIPTKEAWKAFSGENTFLLE